MQTVALRTRLKPGKEIEYEQVHRVIPGDLAIAIREAGATSWRIWRDGRDLFHLVEVEDFGRMQAAMAKNPVNIAWQARMARLLDVEFTYEDSQEGLSLVWSLATQESS